MQSSFINRVLVPVAVALLPGITAFSQELGLGSITEVELKEHLVLVAGDSMQGRDFGTPGPGLEMTADYLKAHCSSLGLKPGPDGYFQEFELVKSRPDPDSSYICITDPLGKKIYETKRFYSEVPVSPGFRMEKEILFAGYGWSAKDNSYDDLAGLDVKGKIVLVMAGNHQVNGQKLLELSAVERARIEQEKYRGLFGKGASAILVVQPEQVENEFLSQYGGFLKRGVFSSGKTISMVKSYKIFTVDSVFANTLIKGHSLTIREVQEKIRETGKPVSFHVRGRKIALAVSLKNEAVKGKNVIAFVEGYDPVLKNECVVLSAHYDHVGLDATGQVFNGADDNGSGTVGLMEIAEAFAQFGVKPARSIVFAWFSAEEKGLLGSSHYTKNPLFPMDKTRANINLDMIGRSEPASAKPGGLTAAEPEVIFITDNQLSKELSAISAKISSSMNLVVKPNDSPMGLHGSDHFNFHNNNVPILAPTTGLHADYHKTSDDVDKIDFEKLKRVSQFAFQVALEVAGK